MLENIGFDKSKVTFKDQSVLDAIDWWIDRMNANDIEDFVTSTESIMDGLASNISVKRAIIERSKKPLILVYDFIWIHTLF